MEGDLTSLQNIFPGQSFLGLGPKSLNQKGFHETFSRLPTPAWVENKQTGRPLSWQRTTAVRTFQFSERQPWKYYFIMCIHWHLIYLFIVYRCLTELNASHQRRWLFISVENAQIRHFLKLRLSVILLVRFLVDNYFHIFLFYPIISQKSQW
jgi:hypothetical protein